MAARALSLDIGLEQVFVEFQDGVEFTWHARILIVPLGAGRWVLCTLDPSVEFDDLSAKNVIPVGRRSPLPRCALGDFYVFDPLPTRSCATSRLCAQL